jgi:protein ImuB
MRLFRERLDSLVDPLDAGFGFDLIRLSVMRTEGFAPAQASLDGRHVEEEEVAELVDRLGVRFGAEAVTRFVPVDTHIPERAAACRAGGGMSPWKTGLAAPDPDGPPLRPIHLFDPPQPIEALAEVPDGPPLRFRWRRVLHEIARAEGPERIAPEWWRHDRCDGLTRDYYRLEDAAGRRFWVFREGLFSEQTPRAGSCTGCSHDPLCRTRRGQQFLLPARGVAGGRSGRRGDAARPCRHRGGRPQHGGRRGARP